MLCSAKSWWMSGRILAFAMVAFLFYISLTNRCDMSPNLKDMMIYAAEAFTAHDIAYWLDYGSLLGAWRDHGIVPWEFDVDMGVREEECNRVLSLRDKFRNERGFSMYGRGEFIPQKAKWGYNGYIRMPCVRVYDATDTYSLDVYWYRLVTPADVRNLTQLHAAGKLPDGYSIYPPDNWSPPPADADAGAGAGASAPAADADGVRDASTGASHEYDLLCNEEGYTFELPGGCKKYGSIFPLQTMELMGTKFTVPRDPSECLRLMYGDWRTPAPKGYKALVCLWVPTRSTSLLLLPLLLLAGVAFVYVRWFSPAARARSSPLLPLHEIAARMRKPAA